MKLRILLVRRKYKSLISISHCISNSIESLKILFCIKSWVANFHAMSHINANNLILEQIFIISEGLLITTIQNINFCSKKDLNLLI